MPNWLTQALSVIVIASVIGSTFAVLLGRRLADRKRARKRREMIAFNELVRREFPLRTEGRAQVLPASVPVLRPHRDTGFFRGEGCWAALESGECCSCGHEWLRGEIIGMVTQAYERLEDGTVRRSPGTRLACCVCVERQRVEGDLSVAWARDAGLLP